MIRFKYNELVEWLREQIMSGKLHSGERIPTEYELARMFSVSRDTVRKGLAELEKENLVYKVKGSGTFVRKITLDDNEIRRNRRSKMIAVVMNDVNDYIFADIVRGINRVLVKNEYRAVVYFTSDSISREREILKELLRGDYAGYIIEPTKSGLVQANSDLYQKIANMTPCVLIHAKIPALPIDSITMGDERAGFKLTEYLLGQGYRDIVFVGKFDEQTGQQRYLGFLKAYQNVGIMPPDKNIFWYSCDNEDSLFQDVQNSKLNEALAHCDAVVCQDDRLAKQMKEYVESSDHFSSDIVICGFDDTEIAKREMFTSVEHPKERFGEYIAMRILDKIKEPSINVSFDFNPRLMVR